MRFVYLHNPNFFLILIALLLRCDLSSASESVKIGILAQRGAEITSKRWNPLADYLNKEIPEYRFSIVPIEFHNVTKAVKNEEVDFLFVNPGIYIELEYNFGVRPIATVRIRHGDKGISLFAGLIFTRADRADIRSFKDLRGKKFMAVDQDSFGGWLMAKRELQLSGIIPENDFKTLKFAGTHDGVVNAVLRGEADAGIVRSDALQAMSEDRLIDISKFRVIHGDRVHFNFGISEKDFPFPHSTDIYPEWPLVKLSATSDELAIKMAVALLEMQGDEEVAKKTGIMGWDIARNYQAVHDLYRELRIGPYNVIAHLRLRDVWQRYWATIITFSISFCTLCIMLLILLHLRLRLLKANYKITEMAMYDQLTHLPNRRFFRILADNALAQARREGWKVYLLLIDLDGFKNVNDIYGHESGDEVLRQISRRLRSILPFDEDGKSSSINSTLQKNMQKEELLRTEDLIARHGGDEFLGMLIHVKEILNVQSIAQRIIDSLQKPIDIPGNRVSVGASIGISIFPDHGENLEELIKVADNAMYEVKRSGKGTFMLHTNIKESISLH